MKSPVLLLPMILLLAACETKHAPQLETKSVDTATPLTTIATGYYSNFRAYTDSLLHRDAVNFTGEKIEVTAGSWSKEEGLHFFEPAAIDVDNIRFPLSGMDLANGDSQRANQCYVIDSAVVFKMGGKRYAYFSASIYNCNAGCRAAFHFIADFTTHKLHWFDVPDDFEMAYVGDIDKDDKPDFIVPYYQGIQKDVPHDSTQAVTLVAYTLNTKGNYSPMLNDNKRQRTIFGIRNYNRQPHDFMLLQDLWER